MLHLLQESKKITLQLKLQSITHSLLWTVEKKVFSSFPFKFARKSLLSHSSNTTDFSKVECFHR